MTLSRKPWSLLGWLLLTGFVAALALQPDMIPPRSVLGRMWRWELAPAAALATLAVIVNIALRGMRWVELAAGHAPASAPAMLAGYAWCTLLFQVVPFRGGDALKVVWMKLRGGSVVRATIAVVVERLLDAACMAFVVSGAVLLDARVADFLGPVIHTVFIALVGLGMAAFVSAGLAAPRVHRWLAARARPGGARLWRWAAEAVDAVALLGAPARFARCCLLSALAWGAIATCYAILADATVGAPLAAALAMVLAVTLATVLGITPGGLGLFEAAGVVVLTAYAVPADSALAAVTLVHAAVLGGQVVCGVAAWIYLSLVEP